MGIYSFVERFSLFYFLLTLIILTFYASFLRTDCDLYKADLFSGRNSANNVYNRNVSLYSVSLVEVNINRINVLTTYKKRILEKSKKVSRTKRSLSKLISIQARMKTEKDGKRSDNYYISFLMSKDTGVKADGDIVEAVINLIKDQVKFMELLIETVILFWDPAFNYGIDISSQTRADHSFLDMLGLGDKGLWDANNYGGRVSKASDTDLRSSDSIFKILGSVEMYRYLMVYNYLLIIGLIYRKGKNFERNIKSKLRLFHNVREGLISSRDSLSLLIDSDLPGDISLPPPRPSPSYLDVGANCNLKIYNEIVEEINFFRGIQDENKFLADKIKSSECTNHDFRGCNSCEIKRTSVLIIEWSMNDIQMDIERLEKDLKLCINNIKKTNQDFCFDKDGRAIYSEQLGDGEGTDFAQRAVGDVDDGGSIKGASSDMNAHFLIENIAPVSCTLFVPEGDYSSIGSEKVVSAPSHRKKTLPKTRNKRYTKRSVVSRLVRKTSKRRYQRSIIRTGSRNKRRESRSETSDDDGATGGLASNVSTAHEDEYESSSAVSGASDTEASCCDGEHNVLAESEVSCEDSGKELSDLEGTSAGGTGDD
ncbi:hypothetical protein FG386_003286 [Cryptosporidium ryanae]|uniref:uncharacterized protein n=1 Tax=Cryptosporidium ryanae TaxID=515981 RepID=UPI003519E46B|nr:hypothetical protein FG386_003286 [Cryptosporidium ryanae]